MSILGPPRVHAFVMAGGSGSRLHPLTTQQCKPALPFGGTHRVVDFVLANLWNSWIPSVHLLVQYQPDSLLSHVRASWGLLQRQGQPFVHVAPPRSRGGGGDFGYRGTADAVHQNLADLRAQDEDLVLVFGADHVYRMDVRQMIEFHRAQAADLTVAALPVPVSEASGLGIVQVDAALAIVAFHEKPTTAPAMPGRHGYALASMGNYVFEYRVLRRALELATAAGETDFGSHVLPRVIASQRAVAYDFRGNVVAGVAEHQGRGYWRDVGSLDAYFCAHMDTLGQRPAFQLDSAAWPLRAQDAASSPTLARGEARCSRFGAGTSLDHAHARHAVLGAHCFVDRAAHLERCVVFDGVVVGVGARLRNVIVDEGNFIPAGTVIGEDAADDRARFPISRAGVVIVPRGHFPARARHGRAATAAFGPLVPLAAPVGLRGAASSVWR